MSSCFTVFIKTLSKVFKDLFKYMDHFVNNNLIKGDDINRGSKALCKV